jgi:phage shock protein PspC (stress-responsive transcriptional regulator)
MKFEAEEALCRLPLILLSISNCALPVVLVYMIASTVYGSGITH